MPLKSSYQLYQRAREGPAVRTIGPTAAPEEAGSRALAAYPRLAHAGAFSDLSSAQGEMAL